MKNKVQLSKQLNDAEIRNSVRIPLGKISADFVSFKNLSDGKEHIALDFRKDKSKAHVDMRIHSECLTGDVFSSSRCDCGEQLNEAIQKLAQNEGVLLYLRQEGRGIGLYNKLDAYSLQLKGLDTYEANQKLGLGDDERDYLVAAQMLKALNIDQVNLLSNNPLKSKGLQKYGIKIGKKLNTSTFLKPGNESYLKAKVEKTGHTLGLSQLLLSGVK